MSFLITVSRRSPIRSSVSVTANTLQNQYFNIHAENTLTDTNPSTTNVIQISSRGKHSKRQVNRLFQNKPMRRRLMMRDQPNKEPEDTSIPEPKYPPVFDPPGGILRNGWSAPPSSLPEEENDFVMPEYPFSIQRTKNKPNGAVGFLPIYSDFRIGGTKVTTIVRKVIGDKSLFIKEMGIAIGMDEKKLKESVRIRAGGNIEINGPHGGPIRKWLIGLGF